MELEPETEENIEAIQDNSMLLEGADAADSEIELSPKELARQAAISKRWIKSDGAFWALFLIGVAAWWLFMTDSFESLAQEYEPLYPAMMSSPLNDDGTYLLISHANW